MPAALRASGLERLPLRGPLDDHGPRRRPVVGRRPRRGSAACRATRSSPRPSSWHGDGFPAWDGFIDAVEATRRVGPRTCSAPDAGFHAGLPAARPALATRRAGPAARPRATRSSASPTTASTPSTTATSATARRAGLAAAGSPITAADLRGPRLDLGRADRRSTTAASGSRPTRPTAPGVVALELLAILERFEPPAASRVRPGRGHRSGLDPPRASRRPSSRWPTATPT